MNKLLLLLAFMVVPAFPVDFVNPVIPGDYPDPSVIRVGRDYYATATTSEWAPIFPILHSWDLVNWDTVGAVFQKRPEWSVGNYWAPEIHEHKGKYFIYYVARKKNGPLSVAVATADKPTGPYTDHGPMISQDAGSIDPFPVEDENGNRYLIWKEDGNSRKMPTPLWIQPLSKDGLKLEGEMKEILRNDLPWEGNVVEGPFVIRKNGYFYLFYAANACCGSACHYGVGVARAKNLLGLWQKAPRNPVVAENEIWKCPGHGSAVQDRKGDYYFLYHAYHVKDSVYVGRQAVLGRIDWPPDGWPVINSGKGTPFTAESPSRHKAEHKQFHFKDDFKSSILNPNWQWPQNNEPKVTVSKADGGVLELKPNQAHADQMPGGILALKTASGEYQATATIRRVPDDTETSAGLCAFGDQENALGLALKGSKVQLWRKSQRKFEELNSREVAPGALLHLRMNAWDGHKFKFSISQNGKEWTEIAGDVPLQGAYLPPWDRGIRIALQAGGSPNATAKFDEFEVEFVPPRLQP
jgi:xylan 1,4-beta-xylosidase